MMGNFVSNRLKEYLRPWKLASLSLGILALIAGSRYFDFMDWDIGISLVMSLLTYLLAPICVRLLLERRWRWLPLVALAAWVSVDGSYWLYWKMVNPGALVMRRANLGASLPLFALCGCIWVYDGALRTFGMELRLELGKAFRGRRG